MPDSCAIYRAKLLESAVKYHNLGWAVIPIRGDSDPKNPKAAAVSWARFQQQRPTVTEIESWFGDEQFGGIGIVCGPISGLIILDFDDADCAAAFARTCPDLTRTFAVTSGKRGLPHYYYRIGAGLSAVTRHTPGADLQAAGTYVIAPPTCIDGYTWSSSYGSELLTLGAADIERLRVFLDAYYYTEPIAQVASDNLIVGNSAADLVRQYVYLARQIGRNNALFRMGSMARDMGWTLSQATAALLDSHIGQPPNSPHAQETPDQRRQEGIATLTSAFRYTPKPCLNITPSKPGLPNAIRENLLQHGQAAAARLLDGLLMAGMKAGTKFTEKIACEMVRIYGIGRRTVQTALKELRILFNVTESPRNPPNDQDANAANGENKRGNNCSFVTSANRVKTFGRPAQHYRLPTKGQLYRWLNVRPSGSDKLDAVDLQSPAHYRRALHKTLIERRPRHYSRRWLAARLGVSVWTSRRYDALTGVTVRASYNEDRICWTNLNRLPLESYPSPPDGVFIEAADGRRYPPLRSIAIRLLRQKKAIMLKRRRWNYYTLYYEHYDLSAAAKRLNCPKSNSDKIHKNLDSSNNLVGETLVTGGNPIGAAPETKLPTAPLNTETQSLTFFEPAEPEKFLWLCPACMNLHIRHDQPGSCEDCQGSDWEQIPAAIWANVERCKVWWPARCAQHKQEQSQRKNKPPLLNARQLRSADQLYDAVQKRTPDHAITHGTARQLVREHGVEAIERAMTLLRERHTIYNAAGFVITVLRGKQSNSTPRKSESTDDHAAWVERLRHSPYTQYYANADQFLVDSL